jgi:hypothetical protein
MKTYQKLLKRIQKREKRNVLKTKNRIKWLWNLLYQTVRKDKGLKQVYNNIVLRKMAVIANRIYIRRSL